MACAFLSLPLSPVLALSLTLTHIHIQEYTGGRVINVFFSVLMGSFALGQAAPGLESLSQAQAAAYTMLETARRKPAIDSESEVRTATSH